MANSRPPFRKVLVANRGEIALRILRACRDLGIPSVAVYSEIDRAAPHVRDADEAYPIGPAASSESYLNIDRILRVARRANVDAIHPGYGFLSENPAFVRACKDAGITFIGPGAEAMEAVGSKIAARLTARRVGVPITPGAVAPITDPAEAVRLAAEIGYPVFVKASAGGGGKGIRQVDSESELLRAIAVAGEEARSAFGDGAVYLEKFLGQVRHIEIQVLADDHGNVITLGERECSLQRRKQKLVEECPSPIMSLALRARMEDAARGIIRACGYVNAGTVEFLVTPDQRFYFLEVNSRLQVEHPITELVRGVDLVSDQFRIAAGEPIGYTTEERPIRGWAMECRITAEDPFNHFLPSTGTVYYYREPGGPGIRMESSLYTGMTVSVHYDPLLAKLVAWGPTREAARHRMIRALHEVRVLGVQTNVRFHMAVLQDPRFIEGRYDTGYIEREFTMFPAERPEHSGLAAIAAAAFLERPPAPAGPAPAPRGARRSGLSGRPPGLEQGWRRG